MSRGELLQMASDVDGRERATAGGGDYTLAPAPDRPVVTEGIADVAAVATSPAREFVLWGTKRADWRASTTIERDRDYAAAVLDAVNIV